MHEIDLADRAAMERLFATRSIRSVVHLGAQAGVRHSLTDPFPYIDSNVTGFLTILEGARHTGVDHLVYASTSSVYGAVTDMPFNVSTPADYPLSLYGATKRANELMAHAYAHLFAIPVTGLRFFTVYGPWGRPDMALFLFTRKILAGEPIDVFNYGQHKRDFTFIDDIVRGVVAALDTPAEANPRWDGNAPDAATAGVPWRVHNIGNQRPVELMRYIEILEQELGARAERNLLPMQAGDVAETYADVDTLVAATGYRPRIQVEEGVRRFVAWYRRYYAL
ncbi:UDP-glucuronate 4-epimerase [Rhodothalassium salexigens DSM 2132]|nr:UDP-glucuronate 4-epimerase [Rhodothalassium salexigens DSM 2132]